MELQEKKKAEEGENYKLPVPVKPQHVEFKPSDAEDHGLKGGDNKYDFSDPKTDDHEPEADEDGPTTLSPKPAEKELLSPADDDSAEPVTHSPVDETTHHSKEP